MAIATNKEILYKDPVEFVEHVTGKTVKTWRSLPYKRATLIVFTDNTCCELDEGSLISHEIVCEPLPKSICVSCGQDMHVTKFDWLGRCEATLKRFWERARKVYWHRYSKNKV